MQLFALRQANLGYGGDPVLRDVTLAIESGERVAIVGPSGAGKSTLIGALYAQRLARTALVPQDGALVPQLSVYHNVYMGQLDRHGALYNLANLVRPLRVPLAAVGAIADDLGLGDKLHAAVGELSGGQKQRTAVGRALYHGGDVLLGDEPVSAVDGWQARQVLASIARVFASFVLVMHDIDLALELATRVIGIRAGRLIFDRPSGELRAGDRATLYG
jgi:phosphonate transport system ATP-binding protein